ncbi:hypothetical protein [Klebsiella oxytoca]|uniref:hypothetical protein n=1 Tax=Klebsiella oxytoca TaxID=571 RepID=UPI003A8FAEF9
MSDDSLITSNNTRVRLQVVAVNGNILIDGYGSDEFSVDIEDNAMSEMSREEIQAHLSANKAEVASIASEMRREMAEWREQNNNQLSQLTIAINGLSSKVDGKLDSVDGDIKSINGKFEGIQGQITGINTAISGIQSGISTRLAIFGVIIAVVVAIPSLISALKEPAPVNQNPQGQPPIVIQVPQQPAPSATPPSESNLKN